MITDHRCSDGGEHDDRYSVEVENAPLSVRGLGEDDGYERHLHPDRSRQNAGSEWRPDSSRYQETADERDEDAAVYEKAQRRSFDVL